MKNTLKNLIQEYQSKRESRSLGKFINLNNFKEDTSTVEGYQKASATFDEVSEYLFGLYTGKNFEGQKVYLESVPLDEALSTADYSVVLRRVINEQMLMPKGPNLFLRDQLTKSVEVDESVAWVDFPTMASFTADWMAEGGPYPEAAPSFGEGLISMKLRKMGIKVSFTEELIKRSIYNLMGYWLQEARNAVDRKKESYLSEIMKDNALIRFNNDSSDTTLHTTGVNTDQVANYTLSYWDLTDMCAQLVNSRKQATHLMVHPLGWRVIADDPLMRSWAWTTGNVGANWTAAPSIDQTAMTPLGLVYTPYYDVDYDLSYTLASANVSGNALGAGPVTDVYVLDKENALVAAERPLAYDDYQDKAIDASVVKLKTYFEASAVDQGKGMIRAKSVRVQRNYEPSYTIRSVS